MGSSSCARSSVLQTYRIKNTYGIMFRVWSRSAHSCRKIGKCNTTAVRNLIPWYTTTSRPNTETSFWTTRDIPNIEVDNSYKYKRTGSSRYNQPNRYTKHIHTTNRQQNTQIQYPRQHRKEPRINMTQATTTTCTAVPGI